jgi:hypothetical protein
MPLCAASVMKPASHCRPVQPPKKPTFMQVRPLDPTPKRFSGFALDWLGPGVARLRVAHCEGRLQLGARDLRATPPRHWTSQRGATRGRVGAAPLISGKTSSITVSSAIAFPRAGIQPL